MWNGGHRLASSLLHAALGEAMLISWVVFAGSLVVDGVGRRSSLSSSSNSISMSYTSSSDIDDDDPFFYRTRLYLASTLPVYFHLVTMFASIWENSCTVRLLGTMYVLSLQRVAVSVVVEEERMWRRRREGRSRSGTRRDGACHRNEKEDDRCQDDDDDRVRPNDVDSTRGAYGIRLLPNSFPLLVGLIARAIFVRSNAASLLLGPPTFATIPIAGVDLVVASCAGVALPRTSFFGVTMESFCIE